MLTVIVALFLHGPLPASVPPTYVAHRSHFNLQVHAPVLQLLVK